VKNTQPSPRVLAGGDHVARELGDRRPKLIDGPVSSTASRPRGWLVRRALVLADALGLAVAFLSAEVLFDWNGGAIASSDEVIFFFATLPLWILVAKLHGLYDQDEEHSDRSTVDDMSGVFHLVTIAAWLFYAGAWTTGLAHPGLTKVFGFWVLAIVAVTAGRVIARALSRRSVWYLQNAIIVGAGDVGQLIARKILQHPEYGINVVGFVDAQPKERRGDLEHLTLLGPPDELRTLVRRYDVERVIVAFSNEPDERTIGLIRTLRDQGVQIDIVPRLFDVIGPKVGVHTVEGLPLVGLAPAKLSRSSRAIKRAVDLVGASLALVLAAPLFGLIALLVKRDSDGPVFFRQKRLGLNAKEFTALKFRTMTVGTSSDQHREFIKATMDRAAMPETNGVFKLERKDEITRVGRWLRKTSLDELPQLINVFYGEMSLVGPRPCLEYETDFFEPHHFDRFLVPAGVTGLWQVTARAHSTFGEALDLDVAYVHSWSLGLDLRLLFRTPLQLLRPSGTR